MGRWKGSPQGPYWDANDSGPNQVDPPPGMSPNGPQVAPQQAQQPQAPSIPYGSEGPGGFTGHAQDPNYWQLGQQQPAKIVGGMPSTSVDPGFNTERGGGMPSLGLPMPGPMDGMLWGGFTGLNHRSPMQVGGDPSKAIPGMNYIMGAGKAPTGLSGALSSMMQSPYGIKR